MQTEAQLRERVRVLKQENRELRAQLNAIAEIVSNDDDAEEEDDE